MTEEIHSQLIKNPTVAWREIEDETLIISPEETIVHKLNATGTFVWKHIDGRHTVEEIAELLAAEYDVSPQAALADTRELLQQLAAKKLVAKESKSS